jgi:hypothetical protein
MSTRTRDAERRQVSLAVEALEDRFLLSGAASLSTPAATNQPSLPLVAAHSSAAKNDASSASQQMPLGQPSVWQTPTVAAKNALSVNSVPFVMNAPLSPAMVHPPDDDGDHDEPPGMEDGEASRNAALAVPPPSSAGNNATAGRDFAAGSRLPEPMNRPAVNPMAFLPLLSAAGLGTTKTAPLPAVNAASETPQGSVSPAPGKDEMRPMPAVPEAPPTPPPPLAEEPTEPAPSLLTGPFAELLPIDMEAIQHGVDAFFKQLGDLSEEWRDGGVFEKLMPWLLAAGVAGYGWLHLRDNKVRLLADFFDRGRPEAAPTIFPPGGEG